MTMMSRTAVCRPKQVPQLPQPHTLPVDYPNHSLHLFTTQPLTLPVDYPNHSLHLFTTQPLTLPVHYPNYSLMRPPLCDCLQGIPNVMRQKKCGMMAAVDEGLRNITNDLRDLGLMDNLLIVFTSDDGGKTDEGSSNWPLRGAKRTLWEGGIRVNTFMYS